MKRLFFALGILLLSISAYAADPDADVILGKWHTTDDKSVVEVFRQNDQFFAKVISLKQPNWPANDKLGMGGKPLNDRFNPDASLRDRPILGLQFMGDFVFTAKNHWSDGKIYDPETGKSYKCKLTLISNNRLDVRGYVGFSLLGRTVTWTR